MDTHNDIARQAVAELRAQFDDQDAAFTLGYFTGLLKQAAELSPEVLALVNTHTAILKQQAQKQ
jgi:hypothetical protein